LGFGIWNGSVLGYCGSFFFNRKVRKEKKRQGRKEKNDD
jgi:hypothetical protein